MCSCMYMYTHVYIKNAARDRHPMVVRGVLLKESSRQDASLYLACFWP